MSEAKSAINVDGLQALISALAARGYTVLGPTARDGAIIYDEIAKVADLPRAGQISRMAGATGWSAGTMMRCSDFLMARNRGSAFCIRRCRRFGPPKRAAKG